MLRAAIAHFELGRRRLNQTAKPPTKATCLQSEKSTIIMKNMHQFAKELIITAAGSLAIGGIALLFVFLKISG